MKFGLQQLKQFLITDLNCQEIATQLTDLGIEVDSITDYKKILNGFIYAKIISVTKHPNADKLNICTIDIGNEIVSVVCGAPNVKANMGVVFAKIGSIIPYNSQVLKKGVIRGIESSGMLCSAKELTLGLDSNGIMEIITDKLTGTDICDVLNLDAIFDVSITPNRGDCFGVYGIARDLSLMEQSKLISFDDSFKKIAQNKIDHVIKIFDKDFKILLNGDFCSLFTCALVANVDNAKQSPKWLIDSLNALNQKSISFLVDLTNYFCLNYARPMHVFDFDKIKGNLEICLSKGSEVFDGLNDVEYILPKDIPIIKDDLGVISIAGIMGGKRTSVDTNTKNVLIESAYFDSVTIAKAAQALNIITDSRQRFERGVDYNIVTPCLMKAINIIYDNSNCNATIYQPVIVKTKEPESKCIIVSIDTINNKLGYKIDPKTIENILIKSNFEILQNQNNVLTLKVPSYRNDINIKEDVIFEIARIFGYNNIDFHPIAIKHFANNNDVIDNAKITLINKGYLESYTWSFLTHNYLKSELSSKDIEEIFLNDFCKEKQDLITINNPISEELSIMKPSAIANLLNAALFNINNARYNGAIFEYAPIYSKTLNNYQQNCLSGLRFGSINENSWHSKKRDIDIYDVKADIINVLSNFNLETSNIKIDNQIQIGKNIFKAPDYYHPYQKGVIVYKNILLGYFGKINPSIFKDKNYNFIGFELFTDNARSIDTKSTKKPIVFSNIMPIERDFSLTFDLNKELKLGHITNSLLKLNQLISEAFVFDIYKDKKNENISIGIRIKIESSDKTLEHEEIESISNQVLKFLDAQGLKIKTI